MLTQNCLFQDVLVGGGEGKLKDPQDHGLFQDIGGEGKLKDPQYHGLFQDICRWGG